MLVLSIALGNEELTCTLPCTAENRSQHLHEHFGRKSTHSLHVNTFLQVDHDLGNPSLKVFPSGRVSAIYDLSDTRNERALTLHLSPPGLEPEA
jgi:hypothetical protein